VTLGIVKIWEDNIRTDRRVIRWEGRCGLDICGSG
jgi:hypothetical protein